MLMTVFWASRAGAANDDALTARIVQDELARQDCLWREALASGPPAEATPELAAKIAVKCSEDIRRSVLDKSDSATEFSRKEIAALVIGGARDRALVILKYLNRRDSTPASSRR
ncbi:hypothetical protein [Bradyrhizobium ivorense]|uniref:hypothetical protein n=1 Tax=Bradyrhizobium ivorense TaxID=2511166 RepID=UPI0011162A70|nr:hypothetical protein [Bradyrhizobium ivorense]